MKKIVMTLIIVLILIIAISLFYYDKANKLKKINILEYENLVCSSGCPIDVVEDRNFINEDCIIQCSSILDSLQKGVTIPYNNYLTETEEYKSCLIIWRSTSDGQKLKECWIEILPKLREKYPYLERS